MPKDVSLHQPSIFVLQFSKIISYRTMNEKNCDLCGLLIQAGAKFCETCAQMMGVETSPALQSAESLSLPADGFSPPDSSPTVQKQFEPAFNPNPNFNQSQ